VDGGVVTGLLDVDSTGRGHRRSGAGPSSSPRRRRPARRPRGATTGPRAGAVGFAHLHAPRRAAPGGESRMRALPSTPGVRTRPTCALRVVVGSVRGWVGDRRQAARTGDGQGAVGRHGVRPAGCLVPGACRGGWRCRSRRGWPRRWDRRARAGGDPVRRPRGCGGGSRGNGSAVAGAGEAVQSRGGPVAIGGGRGTRPVWPVRS
jgi:hypothetical protein